MTNLAIIFVGSRILFPGGDDLTLVTWIADNSKRNVACVLDVGQIWKSNSFEIEGQRATLKELVENGGFSLSYNDSPPDFATAVNIPHWPLYVAFEGQPMRAREIRPWQPPAAIDRSGTLRMPRNTFTNLAGLRKALGVKIEAHWFLEHVPFVVAAKSWKAEEVVPSVALAIGAKVQRESNTWRLTPDLAVLRSRYAGLSRLADKIKVKGPDSEVLSRDRANLAFSGGIFASLSDATLTKVFSSPDASFESPIPASGAVRNQALARMDAMFSPSSSDPTIQLNRSVLDSGIDWSAGFWARLIPRKPVGVKVKLKPGAMGDSVWWIF